MRRKMKTACGFALPAARYSRFPHFFRNPLSLAHRPKKIERHGQNPSARGALSSRNEIMRAAMGVGERPARDI